MKVSRKTDYALRIMLDLAQHQDEDVVTVAEIAGRQKIPQKFLGQIMLLFKAAGFVASKRGQKGGFYLALPPTRITLADIVRTTEGSLSLIECVSSMEQNNCEIDYPCPYRGMWAEIADYVEKKLTSMTVQDMCDMAEQLSGQRGLEYVI